MTQVEGWAPVLAGVASTLSQLHVEKATIDAAEIRQRAQVIAHTSATSASAIELEAKTACADLRFESVKLAGKIASLQLSHDTITTFMDHGVPFTEELNPLR